MKSLLSFHHTMRCLLVLSAAVFVFSLTPMSVWSQEATDAGEEAAAEAKDEKPEEEVDPYKVPEGASVEELGEFISGIKKMRPRSLPDFKKMQNAIIEGAVAMRGADGLTDEQEEQAITDQLGALKMLSRYERESRQKLQDLAKELLEHPKEAIARRAKFVLFEAKVMTVAQLDADGQRELVSELRELVDGKLDRDGYGLAAGLARSIGYTDNTEIAAELYEEMSSWMEASEDKQIKTRAPKMLGAARRLRLPGNFMEVMGTTADGDEFDWSAYRGKVVLVDFWASWCGPCLAEIPNMKRALKGYGEKGFAIVGVNLDDREGAYQKLVKDREIDWVNLRSEKDGEKGWDHPLATYYGVSGIPTAILVDKDGKVLSLRARGRALDELLEEQLGPPIEEKEEEAADAGVSEGDAEEAASDEE